MVHFLGINYKAIQWPIRRSDRHIGHRFTLSRFPQDCGLTQIRIALHVVHINNHIHQEVIEAYICRLYEKDKLEKYNFVFDIFSANNRMRDAYDNAIEMLQNSFQYAQVITVGSLTSFAVHQLFSRHDIKKLPHIFTMVENPTHQGLVHPNLAPTFRSTGVRAIPASCEKQVELLLALRGGGRVFRPYDGNQEKRPSIAQNDVRRCITTQLSQRDCEVNELPIFEGQKVVTLLDDPKNECDIICIDTNSEIIQTQVPQIIAACNKRKITAFSSRATNVLLGAAMGFGNTGVIYGVHAANMSHAILFNNARPHEILVSSVSEFDQVRFNPASIERQGLNIPKDLQAALDARSIFDFYYEI